MKVSIPCAAALALFPLVSAFPAPTAAPGELDIIKYGRDVNEAHVLYPRQSSLVSISKLPVEPSTSRSAPDSPSSSSEAPAPPPSSSSSSSAAPPSSSSEQQQPSTQPSRSASAPPAATSSSASLVLRPSTSRTKIESTQQDGQVITITSEVVVSVGETPSATPSPPSQANSGSSGVSTSTIVGLSVAGGLAALGAIAFIAWKLTRKRFSQFDTDDGVINWPDLQKDPEVNPPRPAPSTTASTTELVKDPYAVPPLPQNNAGLGPYHDEAGFYDPYRGPIPTTFATPPASTDGHPQGWVGGEAIPMSTYSSGRASPGPNLGYGGVDPMQRTGTPVQRMATPVQRMATPVGGATFQEIVRTGTPVGGPVPYRTGTPGYGYGGR